MGSLANELKKLLEDRLGQKEQSLRETQLSADSRKEALDITLPGHPFPTGRLHPSHRPSTKCAISLSPWAFR